MNPTTSKAMKLFMLWLDNKKIDYVECGISVLIGTSPIYPVIKFTSDHNRIEILVRFHEPNSTPGKWTSNPQLVFLSKKSPLET